MEEYTTRWIASVSFKLHRCYQSQQKQHGPILTIHRWIYVMWTYVHREFFDHIWAVYQCVEL